MAHDVLLVEDSPTQAEQIKHTLENTGLTVQVVGDGPEAIREAMINPPRLIVLDINLPSMDGYQVCRRLKRNPDTKDIPVIMLTEQSSAKDTMTGLQAGADDYIPKDIFAGEHLLDTLRELGLIE
ncbi:MAG: response regulator [Chloroflexi bacterium]|nr:MAG: response regulator [Anaerolineae bacterium]MBL1135741.1 response regulator [Chloroflexota bacterium]MBZ0320486.1 response regulator [Anaerolineae bacterium]MCQ3931892.1 response regulator [Chloroflexota bacterium]NOG63845.1 response regulator [Chloroflexota bacterium]